MISKISNLKFRIVYHNFLPSFFRTSCGRPDTNVTPSAKNKGAADLEDYCDNGPIEMTAAKRLRKTATTRAWRTANKIKLIQQ